MSQQLITMDRINDPQLAWMPLHMQAALANSSEEISGNIKHSLAQDYIAFNTLLGSKSGAIAVVGSGPSLLKNWKELKTFKGDILACNSACQFLLSKGIVPTYMMCFDADKLVLEFFDQPHKDITYLIGSRVVPQVWERLEGYKVVCWHAAGDENIRELLEEAKRWEPMVTGGSAAVTRAMMLVMPMGYTKIHIYGGDSSFADGDTHIGQSTTVEKRMAVKCAGRVFETAPWMTMQVTDLKKLTPIIQSLNLQLHFHGDGLLQHVARQLGWRTDYETRPEQFIREWTYRARILWANL